MKVGFLGPKGTYSYEAALKAGEGLELIELENIDRCVESVVKKEVEMSVLPIENSTNGSVAGAFDALMRIPVVDGHAAVVATKEIVVDISHCLVGYRESNVVYSHPQVWGQVKEWMKRHLSGVETVDVSSTSKGALIAESQKAMGISSEAAAVVHGTPVLEREINDKKGNQTRFLLLTCPEALGLFTPVPSKKTLLKLQVEHTRIGALSEALQVLSEYGMNLTFITSRPDPEREWQYIHFIESTGGEIEQAITKLREHRCNVCVLGNY
ncbi:hypothetical protein CANCADRAFT_23540 [Tortispora caseinolytica NRRL Y-17796]|uniref:Prephenate dehydratase domain-containing protein n=1 Tax=Tortispora caseinolytica NRRL Y-17796 TaxID=767744 RepID=A0A1E4TIQ0_9ASCO|nr:hypothetical protein CANCADRAFT_23540 [Tortispora caseinolytica NRRL Y-17796]